MFPKTSMHRSSALTPGLFSAPTISRGFESRGSEEISGEITGLISRWVLGAAVLLGGCAAEPARSPVASIALAPEFHGSAQLARQRESRPVSLQAADLPQWWTGFNDPQLTLVVERVLAGNADLGIALARVQQARALAQQAGAARLPQAELQAELLTQRQSLKSPEGLLASHEPGYTRSQTLQSLGVAASWEADLAGALSQAETAAVLDAQAVDALQAAARVSVVAEAADAYFRARGAQWRLRQAERQVDVERELRDLDAERVRAGLAPERELAQAEGRWQQARAALPALRSLLAEQLNRLDVLMGETAGGQARQLLGAAPELDALGALAGLPALSQSLRPAELLRRRPDLIAAERQLAAADARIGESLSEYYPKLSLGAMLGFTSLRGGLLSSQALQPQLLGGLRWRLFDFGRVGAEVEQARGLYAQRLAEYRRSVLVATAEVETAFVQLAEFEAEQQDLQRQAQARSRSLALAEVGWQGGVLSRLDVLAEQRELSAVRQRQAQLAAQAACAEVQLLRALGGGWKPDSTVQLTSGAGEAGARP